MKYTRCQNSNYFQNSNYLGLKMEPKLSFLQLNTVLFTKKTVRNCQIDDIFID